MQERGQIMTIFVLLAMDINPTLCDSMLPSRMKVQKWRDAILGSIRLVKRVYVSILGANTLKVFGRPRSLVRRVGSKRS